MKETLSLPESKTQRTGAPPTAARPALPPSRATLRDRLGRRGFSFLRTQWRPLSLIGFVLLVLIVFQAVLTPFIIAFALAYVLYPAVLRLTRIRFGAFHLPVWGSILVVYFALIGSATLLTSLAGPPVVGQLQKLIDNVKVYADQLDKRSGAIMTRLEGYLAAWEEKRKESASSEEVQSSPAASNAELTSNDAPLDPKAETAQDPAPSAARTDAPPGDAQPSAGSNADANPPLYIQGIKSARDFMQGYKEKLVGWVAQFGAAMPAFIEGLVRSIFNFFLVLMLTFLFLLHFPKIFSFARSLVPAQYQPEFENIAEEINERLAGVVRGQLMICLANGILTYIGFAMIGVRFASLLAFVAGVLSLIPIFGTIISTIPAVLLALTQSATIALLALGWVVIIHIVEAYVLNPLIMGDAAHMNPLLIVFALLVGSHYFHPILGPLLAAPIAAIIQTVFLHFLTRSEEPPDSDAEPAPASS
ncbi:MAG: AI-2E family transporter [Phycisphaerales bacterium]|nr:AI-2E family transporter [Phycisphaerales bacterium]